MNDIIIVKPEKCVGCNACVRTCPAPEANSTRQLDDGRFVTTVNPNKCIACGECVRTCAHGARDYVDDTQAFMSVMEKESVIILATPSIKTAFPDKWKSLLMYFRNKGHIIYDVSFGADICTWAHLRQIQSGRLGSTISQPCAAIVKYIETYQPKLLKNLSPIHSPISCEAVYIKKYLHRINKIAVLSPCVAKKQEFMETGLIDFNVTFKKLADYFEKCGINLPFDRDPSNFSFPFEQEQGQVGAVYPRPGGLRDNLWLHDPDLNITTSEGVSKVYPELDLYARTPEAKCPDLFDVLSCEHGCNTGPGTGHMHTVFDVTDIMRGVEREAKSRRKTAGIFRGSEDKLFKRFDVELNVNDFTRTYKRGTPSAMPTVSQLDEVYKTMGKHTEEQRHYNCHACGYTSCEAMATAIFRGLNTPDNCIVHAKEVLIARHSSLALQHEKLAEIADECRDLSGTLETNVDGIVHKMSDVKLSAADMTTLQMKVQSLLGNIITFCEAHDDLDADSLKQLIDIIKTTNDAFGSLGLSIKGVVKHSDDVGNFVAEIRRLTDDINAAIAKNI